MISRFRSVAIPRRGAAVWPQARPVFVTFWIENMLLAAASVASALLFANLGDFPLESGKVIHDLKLGYRTYGTRNADSSNVVVFPSWFNGNTEDLESYVTGPNPFLDPHKYFIVAIDSIGNGVSTSPSNSDTQKGRQFPAITIGDMVRSEHKLLTDVLRIKHVYAVAGISMGGMQTFEWVARYPNFADKGISIVGTPHMSGTDRVLWLKMALLYAHEKEANRGKAKAANDDTPPAPTPAENNAARHETNEQLLDRLSKVMADRNGAADPNHYRLPPPINALLQFGAIESHNATVHFNKSLEAMAEGIKAKMLLFVADHDQAVAPEIPLAFARYNGCKVVHLTAPEGHRAFKTERELISTEIQKFLDDRSGAAAGRSR